MQVAATYTLSTLANAIEATTVFRTNETPISHLLIDTRKIHHASASLFIAIKGEHHDGHQYIAQAYQKGVHNFMVNCDSELPEIEANFILVNDTVKGLQAIAKWHRHQFSIPIIGITGSNGKTIVKEWLSQLLSDDFKVTQNPKSYNSQVGVPLSLWNLNVNSELGIFEAGISRPKEMEFLQQMIDPTLGIFTTIGSAHEENFTSTTQKIQEKLLLFKTVKSLVISSQHTEVIAQAKAQLPNTQLISWGKNPDDTFQIISSETGPQKTILSGSYRGTGLEFTIPFTDVASLENALHCIVTALFLEVSPDTIQQKLNNLQAVAMRLEFKQGQKQTTLINDYYNADLKSLEIALDVLSHQHQYQQKTVILSDFLQTGMSPEQMAENIARLINPEKIDRLIAIGTNSKLLATVVQTPVFIHYNSTADFIADFDALSFQNEIILLKGARVFAFEKISKLLQEKSHETVLEINLTALEHNLNYFRDQLGRDVKLMVMVKALAYGSGTFEIANILQFHHVDYLAVAYMDEGIQLRQSGIELPIMVMSPHQHDFDLMLANKLEPEIYSLEVLNALVSHRSEAVLNNAAIHLCIDTGMHRLGFQAHEIDDLIEALKTYPNLRVASIFTHLVGTDEPEIDAFTEQQLELFNSIVPKITAALGYTPLLHALNSAGIQRFQNHQLNMVRLGIGLHGLGITSEAQKNLRPVARLKSTISQVKHIKAGETVGYSRAGLVSKDSSIATVSIGYADGLNRHLGGGRATFYINGQPAKTIGKVCMDMTMLDVTGLNVSRGDEVIIFDENHPISRLSDELGTIPYEILTAISQRVKRIYFQES